VSRVNVAFSHVNIGDIKPSFLILFSLTLRQNPPPAVANWVGENLTEIHQHDFGTHDRVLVEEQDGSDGDVVIQFQCSSTTRISLAPSSVATWYSAWVDCTARCIRRFKSALARWQVQWKSDLRCVLESTMWRETCRTSEQYAENKRKKNASWLSKRSYLWYCRDDMVKAHIPS
jgi:hypothetical protein